MRIIISPKENVNNVCDFICTPIVIGNNHKYKRLTFLGEFVICIYVNITVQRVRNIC